MKKKFSLIAALICATNAVDAQVFQGQDLDINNISARFNSDGSMFNDFSSAFNSGFESPIGSSRHTFFAGNLWIGGIDVGGALKVAAQTYKQTGTDFWPGPLSSIGTTDAGTIAAFNRVWKINQCDIDAYAAWAQAGFLGANPVDSTAMEAINTWPAVNPFGGPLAPFTDLNSNMTYEPNLGETPAIKGDQAIFFVFNDKGGVHSESGGAALGVEIQGMAYAFSCMSDSALYNTIFTNYRMINRSGLTLDSVHIGNWGDLDIGSANDDFIGCDVTRGAYYAYNGDGNDDNPPAGQLAYGINAPAQGVLFLPGPYATANGTDDPQSTTPNGYNYGDAIADNERLGMSKFTYYKNDFSATGNPSSALDYYRYLTGTWKDATPVTYGGDGHLSGISADFMFPGSSDPLGFGTGMTPQAPWDESTAANMAGDRRGLGSSGPFTLLPGSIQDINYAYVFARSYTGSPAASVVLLQNRIDSIRTKFENPIEGCGCATVAGISDPETRPDFSLYPNPVNNLLTIDYNSKNNNFSVRIFDATGKMLFDIKATSGRNSYSTENFPAGIYLLNITDGTTAITKRFIKQ